ncbi:MAG: condensation domain-containing protein, partial [Chthoniobacteraceae bacterium]
MNDLIEELRQRDIKLWRDGDNLRFSAPEGVLSPDLKARMLASKVELLAQLSDSQTAAARIPHINRSEGIPLSFPQERLWVLDQLEPGLSAYNVAHCWRISGPLDVGALERSLQEITRRHEVLRTTFSAAKDATPVQIIHPSRTLSVRQASVPASELLRFAQEEAERPFDLAAGPLLRATLARLGEEEHALLLTWHHIISDAWSCAIFARELSALHAAFHTHQPSPLEDLPLQYADFASWQREKCSGPAVATQLAFWRERLGGARSPLPVPADRPRPSRQSYRGALLTRELSGELATKLRNLARAEGVTLFVLTLTAFKALLARYCGETDICIGSPIAQRPNVESESLIGFFLNMLALRSDFSGDPDFRELLRRERSVVLDAFRHQDVPFEKIVEELHPVRDLSHHPVFQIAFVLQPPGETVPAFAGTTVSPLPPLVTTAKFDLTLFVEETRDGMRAMMEYSTDQFDAATVERMLESLELLLAGIATDPGTPLSRLPILNAAQQNRILTEWSGSDQPYPSGQTIAERFTECAAKDPDAIAVIEGDERLTYADLDARANRVAHFLQSKKICAGNFVGLRAERSLAFVIKVLGIAKAGGAYIPLDEQEPAARLAVMKAACAFVIDAEPESSTPTDVVPPAVRSDGPAYVLFTSGSTGIPKGVIVPHQGIMRLVVNNDYAPFRADDTVAFASNVCFDAATFEI